VQHTFANLSAEPLYRYLPQADTGGSGAGPRNGDEGRTLMESTEAWYISRVKIMPAQGSRAGEQRTCGTGKGLCPLRGGGAPSGGTPLTPQRTRQHTQRTRNAQHPVCVGLPGELLKHAVPHFIDLQGGMEGWGGVMGEASHVFETGAGVRSHAGSHTSAFMLTPSGTSVPRQVSVHGSMDEGPTCVACCGPAALDLPFLTHHRVMAPIRPWRAMFMFS
jgi:hypothetical protein